MRMLAARTGLQPSTLSNIERAITRNPSSDTLARIAQALGLPVSEFLDELGSIPQAEVVQGFVRVPIVRRVAQASGDAWRDDGESVFVEPELTKSRQLLAARVTGECLWPDVEPGEIVVWDHGNLHPRDGDIVVVVADGALMVKRAYWNADGTLELVANQGPPVSANEVLLEGVVLDILRRRRPERRPRPPGGTHAS